MGDAEVLGNGLPSCSEDSQQPYDVSAHMSKKQLRRQQRYEKVMAARRAKRREKKLIRKDRLAREKLLREQEGMLDRDNRKLSKRQEREAMEKRLRDARDKAPRVCVDLGMTDLMSDKELNKLSSQLRRLYGSNRHSERPLHLYFTNFPPSSRLYAMCVSKHEGFRDYLVDMTAESHVDLFPKESLLYLSPDAPMPLPSGALSADTVYVIGGLVDETVNKRVSLERANRDDVSCARLPIEECLDRGGSCSGTYNKILTVNQVFDILLKVHESEGDWENSLLAVVPRRKGFVKKATRNSYENHCIVEEASTSQSTATSSA